MCDDTHFTQTVNKIWQQCPQVLSSRQHQRAKQLVRQATKKQLRASVNEFKRRWDAFRADSSYPKPTPAQILKDPKGLNGACKSTFYTACKRVVDGLQACGGRPATLLPR